MLVHTYIQLCYDKKNSYPSRIGFSLNSLHGCTLITWKGFLFCFLFCFLVPTCKASAACLWKMPSGLKTLPPKDTISHSRTVLTNELAMFLRPNFKLHHLRRSVTVSVMVKVFSFVFSGFDFT